MPTSKEVFALRKEGSLDEAYAMALVVIEANPNDEWNIKAIAWCLYDLTKRSVSQNDYATAKTYVEQLEALQINEFDEILLKSVEHAKVLASPEKRIILQAKEKSKQGNHQEALTLFRQAIQQFPNDIDLNTQFAWELQKEGKIIFDTDNVEVKKARQLLADYIKLKNERPSQLHSLFLRYADKIIDKEEFNLISFLKLWNLNNLRQEDFETFTKEGKTYPSIAEKIIQHGAKQILDKKLNQDVEYFLPFLDTGIKKCQNNIWLTYYKAKLLHLINRNEEAIEFLIPVVKEKIGEFWTWNLLAELLVETDRKKALSCYCKSLLCKGEDKFIGNVRTKFAELLIQKELWLEAKFEIASAIKAKETEGTRVSDRLKDYQQKEWYKNATEKKSNNDFYNSHRLLAEEFIFHSLPWLDGCLGETFTIPDKPDKPRRKLFIKLPKEIIEVVVSDRKFNTSRNYREGNPIKVKGEYDKEKKFQVYLLEKRISQESWDIFPETIGIVDHINKEKGIAHLIVSKEIHSTIKLNQQKENLEIGSKVLLKLKKVTKDRDSYYTVLSCCLTQQEPTENILKSFSGIISTKGEVGFVDDVFIDANLMQEHYEYATTINGIAIINYNKKKGIWGWRAIKIL